ncbi:MAG: hypothetical protein WCO35_01440 [Candidatus Nomurabacteria bacterium]
MKQEFFEICFVCAMMHRHRDNINHDESINEVSLPHFKSVHSELIEKIRKIYQSFQTNKTDNIDELILDKGIEMYLKNPLEIEDINVFI